MRGLLAGPRICRRRGYDARRAQDPRLPPALGRPGDLAPRRPVPPHRAAVARADAHPRPVPARPRAGAGRDPARRGHAHRRRVRRPALAARHHARLGRAAVRHRRRPRRLDPHRHGAAVDGLRAGALVRRRLGLLHAGGGGFPAAPAQGRTARRRQRAHDGRRPADELHRAGARRHGHRALRRDATSAAARPAASAASAWPSPSTRSRSPSPRRCSRSCARCRRSRAGSHPLAAVAEGSGTRGRARCSAGCSG